MLSKPLSDQQEQERELNQEQEHQQEPEQQDEQQPQQEEQEQEQQPETHQKPPIQPSAESCRPQLPEFHKIHSMQQDAALELPPAVSPDSRPDTPSHPHCLKKDLEQQDKGPEDDQTSGAVQSSTGPENDFNLMPSHNIDTQAPVQSNTTGLPMDSPNSLKISGDHEAMQQQNVSGAITSVVATVSDGTAIDNACKQSTSSDMTSENKHMNKIKINNVLAELYTLDDNPDRSIWLNKLTKFMERNGTPIFECPIIACNPIDLFLLYIYVKERGGFEEVSKAPKYKLWKQIGRLLGFGPSLTVAFALRHHYMDNVLPFECHFDRKGTKSGNVKRKFKIHF